MVFLTWDEFEKQTKALFVKNPDKTRYSLKYRNCDSSAVLKVTDDTVCLKYKTDQLSDLKKIDKFNSLFMRMAASKKLDSEVDVKMEVEEKKEEKKEEDSQLSKKKREPRKM
eukprot:TRINITY_DN8719_c0_g1_i1.p3 TRINITY_DN8719_c0_g1~~TRINITY_DN8719_c0_g1_i1.p3  ORF type:complete len:112 (+),score=28.34 TRINITY_DN8719_c0_g1_i1:69-404(+)